MAGKKPPRTPKPESGGSAQMPPFDRRLMEQQMAAVTRLLQEHDFASLDEANAFLGQMMESGGLPQATTPRTPLEDAQQLVYQAIEATGRRREELARKALSISPDCADAYVLLAEAATSPQQARDLYEQGVRAGEHALGEAAFTEDAGHFWGIIETRPYMRARQGLAEMLWRLDEREAAIAHATDMLRLNPGDNQGIRYLLVNWLLAVGDDGGVERLLAQFPDEWSAQWAYSRLLHTFRRSGAGHKTDQVLKRALEVNPYVPAYVLGVKSFPRQMPEYYGMGDENEAIIYLAEGVEAWLATPGAQEWLAKEMIRMATTQLAATRNQPRPSTGRQR